MRAFSNNGASSLTTQHQQIVAAMAKHGFYPACIDGDEQRGRVTTRAGYQRIKARVAKGLTEAVFVFHNSRLGRDASERLALQRELKKLRVPIFSCQQGEIRADLIGGVHVLMDEQFSIDLAYKIKNAMPNAVKNGLYPARTPTGYKRVWPQDQAYARKGRGRCAYGVRTSSGCPTRAANAPRPCSAARSSAAPVARPCTRRPAAARRDARGPNTCVGHERAGSRPVRSRPASSPMPRPPSCANSRACGLAAPGRLQRWIR
jgi:DNA invertase Pin-like site-specific DNA recombinase